MAQNTASGITYNQYLLMAGLVVAVLTGVIAYNNGMLGGAATTEVTAPLDVDGASSEGTSP